MLRTISIECPVCHETTEVSVVVADPTKEQPGIATSSCRRCRSPFLNLTMADGTVAIVDGSQESTSADGGPTVLAVIPPTDRPGYSVRPPPRYGILDRGIAPYRPPAGIADDELERGTLPSFGADTSFLYREDGSRRSEAEVVKSFGHRSLWVAQLSDELGRRLSGPPPLSFPPRIFVSYRWGSATANGWVADLAAELSGRGYPVVFDREQPTDISVPELVSRVADCRFFVAVLDEGYAERVGRGEGGSIQDGWVWDEHQTALRLENQGQMRVVGLLREQVDLPNGFALPRPGQPGNAIDVTEPGALAAVLDQIFPIIEDGPTPETARRAQSLIDESYREQCAGRLDAAFALAQQATDLLPGMIDGIAQKIRVAYVAGAAGVGLAAVEEALELDPDSLELFLLGGVFASDAGEPKRAVELLSLLLERPGDTGDHDLSTARVALGSALDDLDEVHAALGHLWNAGASSKPGFNVTAGYVLRRAGRPDEATAILREGLHVDPGNTALLVNLVAALLEGGHYDEARQALAELGAAGGDAQQVAGLTRTLEQAEATGVHPVLIQRVAVDDPHAWIVCSECPAEIPVGDACLLCARCGVPTGRDEHWCRCCGSDGRVFVTDDAVRVRCPFCRHGTIGRRIGF